MQLKCAQIAIDAGVLDFIKVPSGAIPSSNKGCSAMWPSVQEYIQKTLPRPLPEPEFADDDVKAEAEILDWLNKSFQSANKSRTIPLKVSFHFLQNKQSARFKLHPVYIFMFELSSQLTAVSSGLRILTKTQKTPKAIWLSLGFRSEIMPRLRYACGQCRKALAISFEALLMWIQQQLRRKTKRHW